MLTTPWNYILRTPPHVSNPISIQPTTGVVWKHQIWRYDQLPHRPHRHASTRIGAEFDQIDTAKQGRGIKVQFRGVNIGQIAGKVSKQMASCRRPTRQDKKRQRRRRSQDKASMPLKQT